MKKEIISLLWLILLLSACHKRDVFCKKGNLDIISRELPLASFHSIQVNGSMEVYLIESTNQSVRVEMESNLFECLNQHIQDKTWKIQFNNCVNERKPVKIYISLPELKEATLNGSGYIASQSAFHTGGLIVALNGSGTIALNVHAPSIISTIAGSGKIELNGSTAEIRTKTSGSGDQRLFGLGTRKAFVHISGSGDTEISVTDYLEATISGSGDVFYKGNPQVKASVSGSGKVIGK